jgi:hypothetical protein
LAWVRVFGSGGRVLDFLDLLFFFFFSNDADGTSEEMVSVSEVLLLEFMMDSIVLDDHDSISECSLPPSSLEMGGMGSIPKSSKPNYVISYLYETSMNSIAHLDTERLPKSKLVFLFQGVFLSIGEETKRFSITFLSCE